MKKSTVIKNLSIYFGRHSLAFLNSFLIIMKKYNVLILNKYNLEEVICFIHKFVLAIFWGPRAEGRVEEHKQPAFFIVWYNKILLTSSEYEDIINTALKKKNKKNK